MATMMNKAEFPSIGETIWTGVLSNGLSVFVVPKKGFRSCYALFGTHYGGAMRNFELEGKVHETPEGIAHYLEHKMFDMPEGENALSILSENGADPNAFTSTDMTCYYFSCTSRFEENLRMLLKFVSSPYFTEESVEKERDIITQEILMGADSPSRKIYQNLLSLLPVSLQRWLRFPLHQPEHTQHHPCHDRKPCSRFPRRNQDAAATLQSDLCK